MTARRSIRVRLLRLLGAVCFASVAIVGVAGSEAPQPRTEQDQALDNLSHAAGYETAPLGTLGRLKRSGTGLQPMILIAGAGFDGGTYDRFAAPYAERFRMFSVTLPGFGGTPAPPMPPQGTSYGEQTWTRGALAGIRGLVEDEELFEVVLVAHQQTATQIALELALEMPNRIHAVVLIAGMPRFVSPNPGVSPTPAGVAERVALVDQAYAPRWFRTVTRDTWDDNNFLPGDYARHPLRALQLWRQAASPPLPVLVRYLCEFWAQDVTTRLTDLEVPTLVVIPGLDEELYVPEGRPYMKAFFQDAWAGVELDEGSPIEFVTIDDARMFIMDDQPAALDHAVDAFLHRLESP